MTTLIRYTADPPQECAGALYRTPATGGAALDRYLPRYAILTPLHGGSQATDDTGRYEVAPGRPSEIASARGWVACGDASAADLAAQDDELRCWVASGPAMEYLFGIQLDFASGMNAFLAQTTTSASEQTVGVESPIDFTEAPVYTDGATQYAVSEGWMGRTIRDAHRLGNAQRADRALGQDPPPHFFVQRVHSAAPSSMALNARQPSDMGRRVVPPCGLYQWAAVGLDTSAWRLQVGDPVTYADVMSGLGLQAV